MNKENKVIQTLAAAAVDYYRLTGAGEDSNRQTSILRTAADAYRTATNQPVEVLEKAWEAVATERAAVEQNLSVENSLLPQDIEGFESACTELRQMAENTADEDNKQALTAAADYLHDYIEAAH